MVNEDVLGKLLVDKNLTVSTAESCTGGLIAGTLINYPGISSVFSEGFITYSNEAKVKLIGVKKETIDKYGAVSEETAKEMAEGVAKTTESKVAIAVTGIAGPSGGSYEKPVGLVYGSLYIDGDLMVRRFNFKGDRQQIRYSTVSEMLQWLYDEIIKRYK